MRGTTAPLGTALAQGGAALPARREAGCGATGRGRGWAGMYIYMWTKQPTLPQARACSGSAAEGQRVGCRTGGREHARPKRHPTRAAGDAALPTVVGSPRRPASHVSSPRRESARREAG
eukprot:scaffold523_cov446-Prasinococcus_capsulatus_cf.AAC.5